MKVFASSAIVGEFLTPTQLPECCVRLRLFLQSVGDILELYYQGCENPCPPSGSLRHRYVNL